MALKVVMDADHDGSIEPIELDIVRQGPCALGAATLLHLVKPMQVVAG